MISEFVREQKRYTQKDLCHKLKCSEEQVVPLIRKLKEFGVLKAVKASDVQKNMADLLDEDIEVADVEVGENEYLYVFTFVGVIVVAGRVLKCYPKYLLHANEPTHELQQVIKVLEKYNSKEQIVRMFNDSSESSSFNLLAVLLFLLQDYFENNVYSNTEEIIECNGSGEILWDKTINETFTMLSDNRPYYVELQTRKRITNDFDYFKRLHECVLTMASRELKDAKLLDLFEMDEINLTDEELDDFGDKEYILYRIEKELNIQFNTRKQLVLKTMYAYIERRGSLFDIDCLSLFGTNSFNLVWEKICADIMDNQLDVPLGVLKLPVPLKDGYDRKKKLIELIEAVKYAKNISPKDDESLKSLAAEIRKEVHDDCYLADLIVKQFLKSIELNVTSNDICTLFNTQNINIEQNSVITLFGSVIEVLENVFFTEYEQKHFKNSVGIQKYFLLFAYFAYANANAGTIYSGYSIFERLYTEAITVSNYTVTSIRYIVLWEMINSLYENDNYKEALGKINCFDKMPVSVKNNWRILFDWDLKSLKYAVTTIKWFIESENGINCLSQIPSKDILFQKDIPFSTYRLLLCNLTNDFYTAEQILREYNDLVQIRDDCDTKTKYMYEFAVKFLDCVKNYADIREVITANNKLKENFINDYNRHIFIVSLLAISKGERILGEQYRLEYLKTQRPMKLRQIAFEAAYSALIYLYNGQKEKALNELKKEEKLFSKKKTYLPIIRHNIKYVNEHKKPLANPEFYLGEVLQKEKYYIDIRMLY